MKTKILAAMGTAVAIAFGASAAVAGPTLNAVKQKGFVQCGVNTGLPGFSSPTARATGPASTSILPRGRRRDLRRSAEGQVRAADRQQRFTALQSGEVDILSRNTTWTLPRDTALGLNFAPSTSMTARASWCRRSSASKARKELNGATVCVQPGTTTELNLADYFRANKMEFKPVVIEKLDEVIAAFSPAAATSSRPTRPASRAAA